MEKQEFTLTKLKSFKIVPECFSIVYPCYKVRWCEYAQECLRVYRMKMAG
jgi:hypothetical protein